MAAQIPIKDPTTQSNYTKIATTHLSLDWTVDLEKKIIYGSTTHLLLAKEDVTEVMYVDPAASLIGLAQAGLTASTRAYCGSIRRR